MVPVHGEITQDCNLIRNWVHHFATKMCMSYEY